MLIKIFDAWENVVFGHVRILLSGNGWHIIWHSLLFILTNCYFLPEGEQSHFVGKTPISLTLDSRKTHF